MIKPVNGHILIEPQKQSSFVSTQQGKYDEIGVVLQVPDSLKEMFGEECPEVGQSVFFDSWLASKYPVEGKVGEYYWLVRFEDVRAIQTAYTPTT